MGRHYCSTGIRSRSTCQRARNNEGIHLGKYLCTTEVTYPQRSFFSLVDKFSDKILSRKFGRTINSCSGYTERGYRRIRVVIPAANAITTSKACAHVGWGSHVQHIPIGACYLVVHNQ
jgi:hypothetical protein